MFKISNSIGTVDFHKVHKNSFYPYFFIWAYIKYCMFAKIVCYRLCGGGRASVPPFPEQSDWSIFFSKKIHGCDCVHEMSCQVLPWALCLSCMFLVVVLVFFISVAHFECIDKSYLIAQPLYHFPPHINTLLLRNHFCSRQSARFVVLL